MVGAMNLLTAPSLAKMVKLRGIQFLPCQQIASLKFTKRRVSKRAQLNTASLKRKWEFNARLHWENQRVPWSLPDPTLVGVRGVSFGILVLLVHTVDDRFEVCVVEIRGQFKSIPPNHQHDQR